MGGIKKFLGKHLVGSLRKVVKVLEEEELPPLPKDPGVDHQELSRWIVVMESRLGKAVPALAARMKTTEEDVVVKLFQLAQIILDEQLYGTVATPSGKRLAVADPANKDVKTITIHCDYTPEEKPPTTPRTPPSFLN